MDTKSRTKARPEHQPKAAEAAIHRKAPPSPELLRAMHVPSVAKGVRAKQTAPRPTED